MAGRKPLACDRHRRRPGDKSISHGVDVGQFRAVQTEVVFKLRPQQLAGLGATVTSGQLPQQRRRQAVALVGRHVGDPNGIPLIEQIPQIGPHVPLGPHVDDALADVPSACPEPRSLTGNQGEARASPSRPDQAQQQVGDVPHGIRSEFPSCSGVPSGLRARLLARTSAVRPRGRRCPGCAPGGPC